MYICGSVPFIYVPASMQQVTSSQHRGHLFNLLKGFYQEGDAPKGAGLTPGKQLQEPGPGTAIHPGIRITSTPGSRTRKQKHTWN